MLWLKNIRLKEGKYSFDVCINEENPYQMEIDKWNMNVIFSNVPRAYEMYQRLAQSAVLANYYEWYDGNVPKEYEVVWY